MWLIQSGEYMFAQDWLQRGGAGYLMKKATSMWKLACYPDRCTISDVEYILYDYNTRYMSALPALNRTEGGSAAAGNLAYTAPRQDTTAAGSAAAESTANPNVLSIHDAPGLHDAALWPASNFDRRRDRPSGGLLVRHLNSI